MDSLDPQPSSPAPSPQAPPAAPRARVEMRIRPSDGALVVPAELIRPVMSLVFGWWTERDWTPPEEDKRQRPAPRRRREPPPDARLMTMEDFAHTVGFSKRKIEQFVAEGMPTAGDFRSRRVLVGEAHEWVIRRLRETGDGLVERARLDARKRRSG